jgi:transposase
MGKKNVSEGIKWQIIGLAQDETNSNRKISKIVDVSEKCVRTTLKNYKNNNNVKDLPRSGRPSKLNARDKSLIFREVRKDPRKSLKDLTSEFNFSRHTHSVCIETVRKALKQKGIGSYKPLRKPLLTVRDRIKRMRWCRERLNWSVEDWAKVIWSDESNFEIFNRKSQIYVKRLCGEKFNARFCTPMIQGGGGSVGIWGCFSYKGIGCISLYQGRINQFTYKQTLEKALIPSARYFFGSNTDWFYQHDGAPAHKAKSIDTWLTSNSIKLLPWCARSPDLNPIENIWAWMDFKMTKTKISSINNLMDILKSIWATIPREQCMKLVESMPRRVKLCIKAKGSFFKY